MRSLLKNDKFALLLLLAAALLLRLDFLIPVDFVIDSDEAIVGLMAKHMAEGKTMPVFYYGQHYMGSFEPLLVSFIFDVFGPTTIGLKLVPLAFSLLLVVIVYYLTLNISGSRHAALIASSLTALPPNPLVVWSAKARGGFIEILVLGALAFYYCVEWLKPSNQRLFLTGLIALLLGFGWWTNNQIVYFILPAGFVMLACLLNLPQLNPAEKIKLILLHMLTGFGFFILGGLPYWIYNLTHNFASFEILGGSSSSDILTHIQGLFSTSIPILLGSKKFWEYTDIFIYSTLLFSITYLLLLVVLIYSRRRQIAGLFLFRLSEHPGIELLLLFTLTTFTVFSLSSYGYLVHAPRYLLPLYVAIFPLAAYALDKIRKKSTVICYSLLILLVALNLSSSYSYGRSIPGEPFVYKQQRVSRDHTELISWLEKKQIYWIRTNYWIGYKLAFETNEKIRFDIFQEPNQVRLPEYSIEAERNNIDEMPFVLVPAQAVLVQKAMKKLNYTYQTEFVNGYQVIYDIKMPRHDFRKVNKTEITAISNYSGQNAVNAIDGNLTTRWGSAHPQSADMRFELQLKSPKHLVGLRYKLGTWAHDWPRALKVEVINSSGQVKEVFDDKAYSALRYFTEDNVCFTMFFDEKDVVKVVLSQISLNGIFDWSIAEIELLETENN